MESWWEAGLRRVKERVWWYHILCILVCAAIAWAGTAGAMPLKKLAKSLGTPAAVFCGVCLVYYVLREIFVKLKKGQIAMAAVVDSFLKSALKVLRLAHPLVGILAFYLVLLHGTLMVAADVSLRTSRMAFGLIAGAAMLCLLITGGRLMKSRQLRQCHRLLAFAGVIFFLLHLYVKFKF